MTASTLTPAPGTPITAPGTGASVESPYRLPTNGLRPPVWTSSAEHAFIRAATDPDVFAWLRHIAPAAGCSRPIRLYGVIDTIELRTGRVLSTVHTDTMPDGVIYKPCGNRRASVCPSCSRTYQGDAYQVLRAGLVGGNGVPASIATHPALFVTFTARSFGAVHTRVVTRHTCADRRRCDCRPEPCRPRRDDPRCEHGQPRACFARHESDDRRLGQPLCLDCYDHDGQVVWNNQATELWRRTTIAMTRAIGRVAKIRGVRLGSIKLDYGKVAEMQRRGVVHFHAIIRLDGADPDDKSVIFTPPPELTIGDLIDAVEHAATATRFTTDAHRVMPDGWPIAWGEQLDIRTINVGADGAITDSMVAGYLAKYATKSTEATGHVSRRLTDETIDVYADPDGSHVERLIDACWTLGRPKEWRSLRHWAHMIGFGGHFLTKSRQYSVTFRLLRERRITWRRTLGAGPERDEQAPEQETTLVVNFLHYVGSGWHTTGDALLANTSAAMARERQRVGRMEIACGA